MNMHVNCPNCRFRGRLSDALATLRTIVCPRCKAAVTTDQLRRGMSAKSLDDASFPIFVEPSADHTPAPESGGAVVVQAAPAGLGERVAASEPPVDRTPPPVATLAPLAAVDPAPVGTEPEPYSSDYMKEEAGRFAQYVAARLGELQKKRAQLADAESRFEQMTMDQKQELYRARAATTTASTRVTDRESALQAQAAALAVREASLAAREVEVAARESRVARAESRATETDRRTAELRASIDQLEARRLAMAEEREALNRRAEALDRAELAQHRRAVELDELDERLRLEQDEFEREQAS